MTYSASPKISRKLLLLGIDVSNNLAEGLVTPLPSPSPTPPLVSPHLCNDLWQWMTFNRVQYGWGKFTTRSLFLLPFPNRLELVDAPLRLFLNVNWLQNDAFRPYFPPTRNPIWPPENRKCFEINTSYICLYSSWKLKCQRLPPHFDYVRQRRHCPTSDDIRNPKIRPRKPEVEMTLGLFPLPISWPTFWVSDVGRCYIWECRDNRWNRIASSLRSKSFPLCCLGKSSHVHV